MGLAYELKSLIDELDRVHSGASPWSEEVGIPDFVTAENGLQRFFTQKSRTTLWQFSKILHDNRFPASLKIELDQYYKIVRQAVSDMHAADELSGFEESDLGNVIPKLKALIEERVANIIPEYTHYFPAWTLGIEHNSPFHIGPVTIFNQFDWIDSVDFSEDGKEHYLNQPEANNRWKEILKEALKKPKDETHIEGLAGAVYDAVRECPALIKVTVFGYEKNFSRKLAKLAAKTALDAISLGFGAPEFFQQQALHDERLPPVGTYSLVETKGILWLPGGSIGKRLPSVSPNRVKQALVDLAPIIPAFGAILHGLLDPSNHKHPKLASRWATALDWYGEGCRESNDAIALAKLGTCLDVLSCGGKYMGIKNMVAHLTGTSEDKQVVGGDRPRTLAQLVKEIYDSGRSKILHGTHYDRLESFATERAQAAYLAQRVLIEIAARLQNYKDQDDDKAFRKI